MNSTESDGFSRRDFLKSAGILVSGALLGRYGFSPEGQASPEATPQLQAIEVATLTEHGVLYERSDKDPLHDPKFASFVPQIENALTLATNYFQTNNVSAPEVTVILPGIETKNATGNPTVTPMPPTQEHPSVPLFVSAPGLGLFIRGDQLWTSLNAEMGVAIGVTEQKNLPPNLYIFPQVDRLVAADYKTGQVYAFGTPGSQGKVEWAAARTVPRELLAYINDHTPQDVKEMEGMHPPDAMHPFYWRTTPDGGTDVWAWNMTADNQESAGFVRVQDTLSYPDTDTKITILSAVNPNPPRMYGNWYNGVKFTDLAKQELGKWLNKHFGHKYAHTDIYFANVVNFSASDSSPSFVLDFGNVVPIKGVNIAAHALGAEEILLPNKRKVVILRMFNVGDGAFQKTPEDILKFDTGSIDGDILESLIFYAKRQRPTDKPTKVFGGLMEPNPYRSLIWELIYPKGTLESQRMLTTLTP